MAASIVPSTMSLSLLRARKLALLLQSRQNPHLNHLITSGAINPCFIRKSHVAKARQLHCSLAPKAKTNNRLSKVNVIGTEYRSKRSSVPPRYVQGPTLPGLRIVVRALQESGTTMRTREIWKVIHENSLGAEYAFPAPEPLKPRQGKRGAMPEPTYPTHPVRSIKYLKSVLLATLEANGRVRKVHYVRPPNEHETEELEKSRNKIQARNERRLSNGLQATGLIPQGIDHWVWELMTPAPGTIPLEQRQSIPMKAADTIWVRSLDAAAYQRFHTPLSALREGDASEPGGIVEYKPETEDASSQTQTVSKLGIVPHVERELADKLTTRWQKVALKDEASAFLAGVPASNEWKVGDKRKKINWRDQELEEEKARRKRHLLATAHGKASDWSPKKEGATVGKDKNEKKRSNLSNMGLFNDDPNVEAPPVVKENRPVVQPNPRKKYLNPNEPEYRQSPLGISNVPIALRDPRRRQYGFHYGFPKQKKLLRAANSNDWDCHRWKDKDQPPRDYSHLSPRRQKRRQEQNTEIIHGFRRWKVLRTSLPMIAAPREQNKQASWTPRTR